MGAANYGGHQNTKALIEAGTESTSGKPEPENVNEMTRLIVFLILGGCHTYTAFTQLLRSQVRLHAHVSLR